MEDDGRLRFDREHRIEGCHAIGLGWGDGKSLASVVQCTGANPANAPLNGVKRWEEQMAFAALILAA
jgi:hypothetical protein